MTISNFWVKLNGIVTFADGSIGSFESSGVLNGEFGNSIATHNQDDSQLSFSQLFSGQGSQVQSVFDLLPGTNTIETPTVVLTSEVTDFVLNLSGSVSYLDGTFGDFVVQWVGDTVDIFPSETDVNYQAVIDDDNAKDFLKRVLENSVQSVDLGDEPAPEPEPEPWSPLDLGAKLLAWYDPDDTDTLTFSGADVVEIEDKSGNGHDLDTMHTNWPQTDVIDDLTYLDFLGASTAGISTTNVVGIPTDGYEMHAIAIPSALHFGAIVSRGDSTQNNKYTFLGTTSTVPAGATRFQTFWASNQTLIGTVVATTAQPHLFSAATVATNDRWSELDGADRVTGSNNVTEAPDSLALGIIRDLTPQNPWNGYIGEVVVTTTLTDEERDTLREYMASKANVTLA